MVGKEEWRPLERHYFLSAKENSDPPNRITSLEELQNFVPPSRTERCRVGGSHHTSL